MVRVSASSVLMQISVLWMGAVVGFDLEDQLQQLKTKLVRKNFVLLLNLTRKIFIRCFYVTTKEILAAKVHQIEALERRIEQLEMFSHDIQQKKSFTSNKSVPENVGINRQSTGKSAIPRTCHDIREAHPSQTSGMYWIDPDGQGVGDDPIVVFCNMTAGSN